MCGFVGSYDPLKKYNIDMEDILSLIKHRGPDSHKCTSDILGVTLGFTRLAIIDLSTDAEQPMLSLDRSVYLAFNGEIYNYIELRKELEEKSHIFSTNSDTEVLLHMYLEYGIDMLNRIEGMYSIALSDINSEKLFLIRDRFGIKPLYYSSLNNVVVFGSEIKALLATPIVTNDIDIDAVADFLQFEYIHAPKTIFKDIKKVLPGHYLEITKEGFVDKEYWDCNEIVESSDSVTEAKKKVLDYLRESLKLHLRSDVPLGVFLSGGIDSALLVAVASEQIKDLNTYTLKFENGDFDESGLAQLVAERYRTKHRCFEVSARDMKELFPKMIWFCDEPLGDSGILPNFIINELVSEDGIKVVLSGAGGDELFAGYNYYFGSDKERIVAKHPFVSKIVSRLIRKINPDISQKIETALLTEQCPEIHMIKSEETIKERTINRLLCTTPEFSYTKKNYYDANRLNGVNRLLYTDIKTYLPDDLLLLADRTTMAHSVEGRVPFLFTPLVEYALSIPESVKNPERKRKWLLREIASEYLPQELLSAPKRGFCSPILKWANGDFGKHVYEVLNSERSASRSYWNKEEYLSFVSESRNYDESFSQIYLLFVLEMYMRVHVDNSYNNSERIDLGEIYG